MTTVAKLTLHSEHATSSKLLSILARELNVYAVGVVGGNSPTFLIRIELKDQKKIQNAKENGKLNALNIEEVKTSERTNIACNLFARRMEPSIVEMEEETIIKEINSINKYTQVEKIYKITGNPKMLKICFKSETEAQRALEDGIKLFSMAVPKDNLEREQFINIKQCFNCCKLGHYKQDCKEIRTTCGRCARQGHVMKECVAPQECAICGMEHNAMGMQCPLKKEEVKKKLDEKSLTREGVSYSRITRTETPNDTNEIRQFQQTAAQCSDLAYKHSKTEEEYIRQLNTFYEANGMKPLNMPRGFSGLPTGNKREAETRNKPLRIKRRSMSGEATDKVSEVRRIDNVDVDMSSESEGEEVILGLEPKQYLIYKGTPPRNEAELHIMINSNQAAWALTQDQNKMDSKIKYQLRRKITQKMENKEFTFKEIDFLENED